MKRYHATMDEKDSLSGGKGVAAMASIAFALVMAAIILLSSQTPAGVDKKWLRSFGGDLPGKAEAADAIVVGKRVATLGREGCVSLYRVDEVIKGEELISVMMAPYPDVPDCVFVAYENPRAGAGHMEPEGKTLLFMRRPVTAGKNMHLLGDSVDEGMIYALPALVERTRILCGK